MYVAYVACRAHSASGKTGKGCWDVVLNPLLPVLYEEPVPSDRGSSWYKQIYPNPDLSVQCIKLRTIFLICAFAACRFFAPVLQGQGMQEGWVGRGSSQGPLVNVSSLLWPLLCWKAFSHPLNSMSLPGSPGHSILAAALQCSLSPVPGLLVRASFVTSAWVIEAGLE